MHFPQSYHEYTGLDESLFLAKPDRGDVFRSASFKKLQDNLLKDAPQDFVVYGAKGVGKTTLLVNTLMHLPVGDWEAFYAHPMLGGLGDTGRGTLTEQVRNFLTAPGLQGFDQIVAQFAKENRGFALVVDKADSYGDLEECCLFLRESFLSQNIPIKIIKSSDKKAPGAFSFELSAIGEQEVHDYLVWGIKDYTKLKNAGFDELADYIFNVSGGNFGEMRRLLDVMLVDFIETGASGVSPELCLRASNKFYSGVFYTKSNEQLYMPSVENVS